MATQKRNFLYGKVGDVVGHSGVRFWSERLESEPFHGQRGRDQLLRRHLRLFFGQGYRVKVFNWSLSGGLGVGQ